MKTVQRCIHLGLILCLVLGWAFYIPVVTPVAVHAEDPLPPIVFIESLTTEDTLTLDSESPDALTADLTVGSPPCTYVTIAAAITAANPGDQLLLEGGVTFTENLSISENLVLQGGYNGCGSGSSTATTIDGGGLGHVFTIDGSVVTLRNLQITNGKSSNGGGVYVINGAQLTLDNTDVYENEAINGGGAYVSGNSMLTLTNDSDIHNNTVELVGGGIRLYETSTLNIVNGSAVSGNQATNGEGGAIAASGTPDINISDSTFQYNTTGTDGGAIYIDAGTLDFTGAWNLSNNMASGNGGALAVVGTGNAGFYASGGASQLNDNQAGGDGGALYVNNTTLKLYATQGYSLDLIDNNSGGNGGAAFADNNGFFDVYGQVIVTGNQAAGNGGAFYLSGNSKIWLDDYVDRVPTIRTNWAQNGGAIYAVDSPRVECDGAEFGNTPTGNYATSGSGGAIYLSNSTFNADNCVFYNNQATLHGGAIAANDGSTLNIHATYSSGLPAPEYISAPDLVDSPHIILATACNPFSGQCSVFHDNIADSDSTSDGYGGAIYNNNGTLTVTKTYLHHNAAGRGGAIYQTGAGAVGDVSNTLVYKNSVSYPLGAGIRKESGTFIVTHVTLADNIGGSGFSGTATGAYNTIAWGNSAPGFASIPSDASCNIDDGGNAGLNVDPEFVAPGADENYHLQKGSPAIDACATGLPTDLDGTVRPHDLLYDMGVYEYYKLFYYLPLVPRN